MKPLYCQDLIFYSTIYLLLISSKQTSEQPENRLISIIDPLPWLNFSGRKSGFKIYTEHGLLQEWNVRK